MRPNPISLERFSALADAYGADLGRWPEADRAAAQALAQDSAKARARLAEADALDAVLDLSRVASPSPELRQRILSEAPKPRAIRSGAPNPASARSRLMRWLSGLGAIGVLTCGAMAGAAVVAVSGPAHVDADSLTGLYDQANSLDAGGA
jgi:hypothetical protein